MDAAVWYAAGSVGFKSMVADLGLEMTLSVHLCPRPRMTGFEWMLRVFCWGPVEACHVASLRFSDHCALLCLSWPRIRPCWWAGD